MLRVDQNDLHNATEELILKALMVQYELVTGHSAEKALPSALNISALTLRECKKGNGRLGVERMFRLQKLAGTNLFNRWLEVQRNKHQ